MIAALRNAKGNQGLPQQDALDASITTVTSELPGANRQFNKHYRLLIQRQQKQRAAVQGEEQHEFDDLMKVQNTTMSSILAFDRHRVQYEHRKKRELYYSTLWNTWKVKERLIELEKNESKLRYKITLQEHRMRTTLTRLQQIDGRSLLSEHTVKMLIFSEKVRRAAFYRQELEEAISLNIPGFDPEIISVEGISDGKLDWMKNVQCPFIFADNCPFFPARVRDSLANSQKHRSAHGCPAASLKLKKETVAAWHEESGGEAQYFCTLSVKKKGSGEILSSSSSSLCILNNAEKNRTCRKMPLRRKTRSWCSRGEEGKQGTRYDEVTSYWADKMSALSRANRIALKSALNQDHYSKNKCPFLPSV